MREAHSCLVDKGYRVVAFDQLGTGASDRPDDLSLWTIGRYVEETETVRKALGLGKVHMLGHSWGGWLAIEYALTYAQNLKTLILEDTVADMTNRWKSIGLAALLAGLTLSASYAEAAGVLTIGRREDSTTFDPIKTAQNIDNWVFSNVYDVLIRVDKTGTKLEPGLAESWTTSDDGLTYTFKIRDAKFSDGSPLTAEDAAYSLLRIRDDAASLWSDSYKVIDTAVATDAHTLTIKLKNPSAPFLSTLALPNASVISKKGMKARRLKWKTRRCFSSAAD